MHLPDEQQCRSRRRGSLGSLHFGLFTRRHVSAAWAQRHLAGHISLSGECRGCVQRTGGKVPKSISASCALMLVTQYPLRASL